MDFSKMTKMFEMFYHFLFGNKKKIFNFDNQSYEIIPLKDLEENIEKNIENKIKANLNSKLLKYSYPNFFYTSKINIIDNDIYIEGFLNSNGISTLEYKKISIKNYKKGIILYDLNTNDIVYTDSYKNSENPYILCQISNIKTTETDSFIEKEIELIKEYKIKKINLFADLNDINIEVLVFDKYSNAWNVYLYNNKCFSGLNVDAIKTKKIKIRFFKDNIINPIPDVKKKLTSINHIFSPLTFFNPLNSTQLQYQKKFQNNLNKKNNIDTEMLKNFNSIFLYAICDYYYNPKENKMYKFMDNQWFQDDFVFIGFIDNQGFYFFKEPVFEFEPFIYKGANLSIKNIFFDENINVNLIFSKDPEGVVIENANKYFRIIKTSEKIDIILHSDVYMRQILKNKDIFLKIILERSF